LTPRSMTLDDLEML